jgi:hypothetical protein
VRGQDTAASLSRHEEAVGSECWPVNECIHRFFYSVDVSSPALAAKASAASTSTGTAAQRRFGLHRFAYFACIMADAGLALWLFLLLTVRAVGHALAYQNANKQVSLPSSLQSAVALLVKRACPSSPKTAAWPCSRRLRAG